MKIRLSIATTKIVLLLLTIRIILDLVYFSIISPGWGYAGFKDMRTVEGYIVSIILLLLSFPFVSAIINNMQDRVSSLIITVLYLISYIPFTVCVFAGIFPEYDFVILNSVYWFVLLGGEYWFLKQHANGVLFGLQIGNIMLNNIIVKLICFVCIVTILYISGKYTGFRLNFGLFNVYDLRNEARGFNIPILFSYILSWSNLINPFMIGYCLVNRKKIFAGVLLLVQFLSFGIAGHKSVLFAPLLVILGVVFFRDISLKKIKYIVLKSICGMGLIALLEQFIFSTQYIAGVFIRRILFVPNHIAYSYYDFFSTHVSDYFRGSFLRHFGFVSPYPQGISRTIGDVYYNIGNSANNGLFSDGFSNLNYFGLVFMPLLLVILLYFLDICSADLNLVLVSVVSILFSIEFLSTALFTVMMTHGLLVICFIMMLLKRERQCNE